MLYSQEELPETVFKSLLAAPHARKIFTSVYDKVWRQADETIAPKNSRERDQVAAEAAWRAVKEAYGLAY